MFLTIYTTFIKQVFILSLNIDYYVGLKRNN